MTALLDLKLGDFVEYVDRPELAAARLPCLWYILRLHPNFDLKAERQLRQRGVLVYVPKEKRTFRTGWNRRALREVPIFPGAMFVPDFEANLGWLKSIADGVGGFVRFGSDALKISAAWMERIRCFEIRVNETSLDRKFKVDQAVRINGGPFDLWEGKIERLDSHHRLRVLITLLEREVPVECDEDRIEAV